MAEELLAKSKTTVGNVDLSQSTFWAKNPNDVTVVIDMSVPEGEEYKISAFLKNAKEEEFAPLEVDIIDLYDTKNVVNDKFTAVHKLQFGIDSSMISAGTNVLKLIVEDVHPAEGTTGQTEYDYDLVVEHRNSFKIVRPLRYRSEYLISGSGSITNEKGFSVNTSNGVLRSTVIPRRAIEMDGRATIRSIIVDADEDSEGACKKDIIVQAQDDEGDFNVQKIPFSEVLGFSSIDKIQAIDAKDAR